MRPSTPPKEKQTREALIDPALAASNWQVATYAHWKSSDRASTYAVKEYPTDTGPTDYALAMADRILGVVEAKQLALGPQNVLTQAERYARGLTDSSFNCRGFRVPFLYATNGEAIWFHDIRDPLNRSRKIAAFHTPDALSEMLERDFAGSLERLAARPNDNPKLRPYQIEANIATEKALAERKRKLLIAMATGTGKTFTMVNQIHRLMESGAARCILFLVDRRALAAQAVQAFASFEADPGLKFDRKYEVFSQKFNREEMDDNPFNSQVMPAGYLLAPRRGHAFVYICTIQRMTINLFGREAAFTDGDEEGDNEAEKIAIPIHAFDLVIADECHRGYTSAQEAIWRRTLDYFDGVKIGLTATPAQHTAAYFGAPVYNYGYERAVREGYLVDYETIKIKSGVRVNGLFLKEGEGVEMVDPESGVERLDRLEDERVFEVNDIERKATSPDSNRKILEEIRRHAQEHEARCGRFPKTLIFAVNDLAHTGHADRLVDMARDIFGRGDGFVRKITGKVDKPLAEIKKFRNLPEPGIAVTVDLLSTGVDIPDLEYIVLLRPIRSRILFEQILGRGTRKSAITPAKECFTVFDGFDGTLMEYFRQTTGITTDAPLPPARSLAEIIEDIWIGRDRDYNTRCLVKRLHRIDRAMSGEARPLFAAFIPEGDLGRFATGLASALARDFTGTMKILRDPAFQALLLDFPRPPKTFLVALEHVDQVSSERLVGGLRPADYLAAFASFVKENPARVEAIAILLERPKDWSAAALSELRNKLYAAPERFSMENLQKAHEQHYHKSLVEIVSMVKHAAYEEEPLLTAAERIERAMNRIAAGLTFTDAQEQWWDRIRGHLTENLAVSPDDFDELPVFSRHGGWSRANRDFNGMLETLLQQLNEAVAA